MDEPHKETKPLIHSPYKRHCRLLSQSYYGICRLLSLSQYNMVIYAMAGTIFNKNDGVSFAFVYVIASHNFFDNKNKLLMQGQASK